VLRGAPALALPLPGAMHGRISHVGAGVIRLNPPLDDERAARALACIRELIPGPGFQLDWESTVWPGAGLGASASLSSLLAGAAWRVAHPETEPDPTHLAAVTHHLEQCFHGTASGIDDAVVCLQSAVLLQRPKITVRWPFFFSAQAAHLWQVTLPMTLPLVVGYSGAAVSTRDMVERVNALAPVDFADRSGALLDAAVTCLENRDSDGLGRVLCQAHELLARVRASTPALDRMVSLALAAGACGAKLTGSGGGGCALALCPAPLVADVADAWRTAGFHVLNL
jgi:mevalonate kinase